MKVILSDILAQIEGGLPEKAEETKTDANVTMRVSVDKKFSKSQPTMRARCGKQGDTDMHKLKQLLLRKTDFRQTFAPVHPLSTTQSSFAGPPSAPDAGSRTFRNLPSSRKGGGYLGPRGIPFNPYSEERYTQVGCNLREERSTQVICIPKVEKHTHMDSEFEDKMGGTDNEDVLEMLVNIVDLLKNRHCECAKELSMGGFSEDVKFPPVRYQGLCKVEREVSRSTEKLNAQDEESNETTSREQSFSSNMDIHVLQHVLSLLRRRIKRKASSPNDTSSVSSTTSENFTPAAVPRLSSREQIVQSNSSRTINAGDAKSSTSSTESNMVGRIVRVFAPELMKAEGRAPCSYCAKSPNQKKKDCHRKGGGKQLRAGADTVLYRNRSSVRRKAKRKNLATSTKTRQRKKSSTSRMPNGSRLFDTLCKSRAKLRYPNTSLDRIMLREPESVYSGGESIARSPVCCTSSSTSCLQDECPCCCQCASKPKMVRRGFEKRIPKESPPKSCLQDEYFCCQYAPEPKMDRKDFEKPISTERKAEKSTANFITTDSDRAALKYAMIAALENAISKISNEEKSSEVEPHPLSSGALLFQKCFDESRQRRLDCGHQRAQCNDSPVTQWKDISLWNETSSHTTHNFSVQELGEQTVIEELKKLVFKKMAAIHNERF